MYYLRIKLRPGPWDFLRLHRYALGLQKRPWKDREARNWVPRQTAGGPCRIPVRWRPRPVGRGWGNHCGLTKARFGCLVGEEKAAGGVDRGSRRRRPLELLLRRCGCPAEYASKTASNSKGRRGWRHYIWGTRPVEPGLATTTCNGAGGRLVPGWQGIWSQVKARWRWLTCATRSQWLI
jgi:hypothetical protein